jgi:Helix-turn-helix domain of resolvase
MPQRKSDLPPADQLATLLDAGLGLRGIARRFGVSHMTIKRRLPPGATRNTTKVLHTAPEPRHKATGVRKKALVRCENPTCDRLTTHPPYCDRCRMRVRRAMVIRPWCCRVGGARGADQPRWRCSWQRPAREKGCARWKISLH